MYFSGNQTPELAVGSRQRSLFLKEAAKAMAGENSPKQERIDRYIDQNLKKVLSDLEKDELPGEIVDLLSVLRAQDKELKEKK
ncbi:MAG: hypothetical protein ACEPO0_18640 [Yoonia sp.]